MGDEGLIFEDDSASDSDDGWHLSCVARVPRDPCIYTYKYPELKKHGM